MTGTIRNCAAILAGALTLLTANAMAQDAPPASAFARLPAIEAPTLSPDGTRIATLENREDGSFLIVRRVEDFAVVQGVALNDVKARGVLWAGDNFVVLIFSQTERVSGFRGPLEFSSPAAVDLSDGSIQPLMTTRSSRLPNRQIGGRRLLNTNLARIVGVREDGMLLIPTLDGDYTYDLFAVDPANDERDTVADGERETVGWIVGPDKEPAVRVDFDQQPGAPGLLQVRQRDAGGFWPVSYQEEMETPEASPIGLDARGRLIMARRSDETGRMGLFPLDLESGSLGAPLALDEDYDVTGAVRDPYSNTVLGARIDGDEPMVTWFDEGFAADQETFNGAFGGARPAIVSWSRDRNELILQVTSGETPPVYFLYEREANNARPIQAAYPEVYQAGAAPRLAIRYPARDGTQIPAYLTIADDTAQPAPLVVLPHGGPEARDVAGFDWMAHFLASRGYAVLQPNYRGSDGYGAEWRNAGRGGWGTGVMQHDVTDGVRELAAAGIADPERVCIVGASYGGYAALAGAVYTPELYRCAAAIAPVTDLNRMIEYERSRRGFDSWIIDYWEEVMGGELGAAGDRLAAISPARNAGAAQAPILLIHGRDDSVVPIAQSRRMEDALTDAGKDVAFIELDGEDHWLSRAGTRLAMLEALETFLAEHLGD